MAEFTSSEKEDFITNLRNTIAKLRVELDGENKDFYISLSLAEISKAIYILQDVVDNVRENVITSEEEAEKYLQLNSNF